MENEINENTNGYKHGHGNAYGQRTRKQTNLKTNESDRDKVFFKKNGENVGTTRYNRSIHK